MHKPKNISCNVYISKALIRRVRYLLNLLFKHLLKRKKVWNDIENFKNQIKAYPQFTWSYDRHYCKYYVLYKTVRKLKPQCILELGSGISTAIIVSALKENGTGQLMSIDEFDKYGAVVEKIVGNKVYISETEETNYNGIYGTKYKNIPNYDYDLIFVDGPTTETVDLDAFYFLEKKPNTKIIIDNRKRTSFALLSKYHGKFNRLISIGYVNFN